MHYDLDVAWPCRPSAILKSEVVAAPGVLALSETCSVNEIVQLVAVPAVQIVACHYHGDVSPAGGFHNHHQTSVVTVDVIDGDVRLDPAHVYPDHMVLAPLDGVEDRVKSALDCDPRLDESGQKSQSGPHSHKQRVG